MTAHDVTIAGFSAVIDRRYREELVSIFPLQATRTVSSEQIFVKARLTPAFSAGTIPS